MAESDVLRIYSQAYDARNVVGITYITLSLTLLTIYTPFNIMLIVDSKFNSMEVRRLMLVVGIIDGIQLLSYVYAGLATLSPDIVYQAPMLCQIIGATKNAAWNALFPLTLLMALYRFMIVRGSTKSCETFKLSIKIALVFCFVYCLAFWICRILFAKISYHPSSFIWEAESGSVADILSHMNFAVSMSCMSLAFLTYIAIVISIYKMSNGTRKIGQSEKHLLIHAAILFSVLAVLIFVYHYFYLILPVTMWTYFSMTVYWILYCGLNPILYIIFSKYVKCR